MSPQEMAIMELATKLGNNTAMLAIILDILSTMTADPEVLIKIESLQKTMEASLDKAFQEFMQ